MGPNGCLLLIFGLAFLLCSPEEEQRNLGKLLSATNDQQVQKKFHLEASRFLLSVPFKSAKSIRVSLICFSLPLALIFITTPEGGYDHFPHIIDEDTEAQED